MSALLAKAAINAYTANHSIAPESIADTAADLLAYASGLNTLALADKIASVQLTGTANVVTAAQANSLAALPGFSLAAGATLVLADTAANLLASGNAAVLSLATTVQLTGDNTVSAAQAASLVAIAHFSIASSAVLHVVDTAGNLLNTANSPGVSVATFTLVAGSVNVVTASQMAALAALPKFGVQAGATIQVSDSAANLIANASLVAKYANSTVLTGTAAVTSSQAATLEGLRGFSLASGAALNVADTAANLLSGSKAAWLGKTASVTLTGTSNSVSAYQATVLAGIAGFSIRSGATLTVTDTAANLLGTANAAGVADATAVVMTGTNKVTAAQAEALASLPGFTLAAGATLTVADTAANLQNAAYAGGLGFATALTLTGDNVLTVADAGALAQVTGLTKASNAVVHIEDSAANLLTLTAANGKSLANYTLITGANTVTAAQATALAALPGFGSVPGATLTVTDTAAAAVANGIALARYANTTVITGQNTISAANAVTLAADYDLTLGQGAMVTVQDSWANFNAAATAINVTGAAHLHVGYGQALVLGTGDFYHEILSAVPVASARVVQAPASVISFSISDTAADLTGAALAGLEPDTKLTGITISDSGALTMSYAQFTGLSNVIALITGNFSIDIIDAPVSAATSLQDNAHIAGFTVADAFANVSANYMQLQDFSKLTAIDPTYTATFLQAEMPFYAQFSANSLSLSDVPLATVDSVNALASVAAFTVTDTADHFMASGAPSDFTALTKITQLNLSLASGGDTLDLSATSSAVNAGGTLIGDIVVPVTVGATTDTAYVSAGLSAPALTFVGTTDAVTLGTGTSTVDYTMQSSSGVETIGNFTYGTDTLDINLNGALASVLNAYDTTVNGQKAIAITSVTDDTHGVVLVGVASNQSAADLIANHLTTSGGHALIT